MAQANQAGEPKISLPAGKREQTNMGQGSEQRQRPPEERTKAATTTTQNTCRRSGRDGAASDAILEASIALKARVGGGRTAPHERVALALARTCLCQLKKTQEEKIGGCLQTSREKSNSPSVFFLISRLCPRRAGFEKLPVCTTLQRQDKRDRESETARAQRPPLYRALFLLFLMQDSTYVSVASARRLEIALREAAKFL